MAISSDTNSERSIQLETEVDVVAVPAIGADPQRAWIGDDFQRPWLISELTRYIPNVRVLLLDHGPLDRQDDLDSLAHHLLKQIHAERQHTSGRRPILFICHGTGGLVAKAALSIAAHSTSNLASILTSCYGIAFMATPHQGSSYLSAPEYAKSIRRLMQLKYHVPHSIREMLKPRHPRLLQLSNQFRSISADIKIWTFLETVDSTLTVADSGTVSTVEMHVPITSIRSGVLDLEHEKVIPLATDHVGVAAFKGQELTTRISFIKELQPIVAMAVQLSKLPDAPLRVSREVMVQVNGFFEDTARGVSDETPLKLWSTKTPLREYLKEGPAICLTDRLKQTGRISSGSIDDSSISDFDSRPSSAAMADTSFAMRDGVVAEASAIQSETVSSRPSIRRTRSFVAAASPRIHVTEAAADSYFNVPQEEATSDIQSDTVSSEDPGHRDSVADDRKETTAGISSPSNEGQPNVLASLSSKYRNFLPLPPPTRERLQEVRAELPRRAPRFDRPEPGSEKLLWIHVPYTHTGWVPPVLSKACNDQQRPEFFKQFINDKNWYSQIIRARHLEPHARFVRPTCIHSRLSDSLPISPPGEPRDPQLALYLPYLHWDTYWNLLQRRKVIEKRLQQGRSKPVPEYISDSHVETRLIWKFLGAEPPIHIRRTLDQYGYPNLRSTIARDDDQMLWKRTRKVVDLSHELGSSIPLQDSPDSSKTFVDGKVLMVDQLWLWIVDEKTVVTFFPKQEATTAEDKLYEQANLHNSIYNELNGDLARRFETAGDLAALIVLHAVTILLDRTLDHDLQILRIFEESISILTESTTKSFKRFRTRGFIARPADYNRTLEGKTMTASERDERDRRVANQNREDLSTLLELRDIIDELGTILKLLEQQTATVKIMAQYFEDKGYGKVFIESALSRLEDYRTQVTDMRENAHLAQKAVENLLDLKQKQANVDESRITRWQAEVAQNQSQSVMVFTIFTVIFLPLSFFTSLFGVNVREWSGEETNPDWAYMLAISGPTSAAIILIALSMAFSERLRDSVVKAHIIGVGIITDFFLLPVKGVFKLGAVASPAKPAPGQSESTGRLDRYLGNRRYNKQFEDDIWKRHEDRVISPLPAVHVSDMEGMMGFDLSEKGGRWQQSVNGA
ncbi:hypothetical protein BDV30DRAFT_211893 [Aspergillus minisclerotigenes]|uniref:DUF676 domain-containing protein n=1 Tax=Aspergillus minisclerotigenes TaxID=656917 RepID=A0A5N6J0X8_9EURO|nr:hypothetical protein BDV30DRAFT_211893 [Aspergillus minisclerotigenes]